MCASKMYVECCRRIGKCAYIGVLFHQCFCMKKLLCDNQTANEYKRWFHFIQLFITYSGKEPVWGLDKCARKKQTKNICSGESVLIKVHVLLCGSFCARKTMTPWRMGKFLHSMVFLLFNCLKTIQGKIYMSARINVRGKNVSLVLEEDGKMFVDCRPFSSMFLQEKVTVEWPKGEWVQDMVPFYSIVCCWNT